MLFSSLTFLYAFLPVTVLLYFLLPDARWRGGVLVAASLVFYAWVDPRSLPLLAGAVLLVWLCGLGIAEGSERLRRFCFAAALALLIGSLFLFKYLNFFADTLSALTGIGFSLRRLALPAAISFTTFQLLGYVIDLKRGTITPEKSFFRFLLFVCFFPQLMQGPIVRYGQIEGELSVRQHSWDNALAGAKRFVRGLAKKVLLADSLAALVGAIYAAPELSGTGALWLAGLCYTLQIYFDFSGYSDMAIGLGLIFGLHLPENFRYPYASRSVSEFWRRWHMTLSFWFRDYVYIPLGGNRVTRARYLLNILIVWALTGLWHGASWNYVLWGLYNGVLLLLEKLVLRRRDRLPALVQGMLTFVLVLLGMVIFSLPDLSALSRVLRGMFIFTRTDWHGLLLRDAALISKLPAVPLGLLLSFPIAGKLRFTKDSVPTAQLESGFYLGLLTLCIVFMIGASFHSFLYFNF